MQVREKKGNASAAIDDIAEFILDKFPGKESGIVYCFSRKECEQVWFLTTTIEIWGCFHKLSYSEEHLLQFGHVYFQICVCLSMSVFMVKTIKLCITDVIGSFNLHWFYLWIMIWMGSSGGSRAAKSWDFSSTLSCWHGCCSKVFCAYTVCIYY